MKKYLGLGSIIGGGSLILLSTQPVWADATQITGVQVSQTDAGMQVVLQTRSGDRPQIFTVERDNALTADIINAQLDLPQGNGYLQNNPAPGISSIMVTQLDANSIRVTVNGEASAPAAQVQQDRRSITLSYAPTSASFNAAQSVAPAAPMPTAPAPANLPSQPTASFEIPTIPAAPPPANAPIAQVPLAQSPDVPAPDILIPNPEITIEGAPAQPPSSTLVPPLLPRAIAPPLGDISVSNVDSTPDVVTLGTGERIPRLVLRDAPARDVLSLLGRAAGINVAYIGGATDPTAAGAAPPPAGQEAVDTEVRISLDIENERVEDVFNYVLRITGLEANRVGRTVFVGPRLPDEARNVIARTLRLNQVPVTDAANFLATQGAESRQFFQQRRIESIGEGAGARVVEVLEPPQIVAVQVTPGNGPLLLEGLSVTVDPRLNAITLVGTPRRVEIASVLLQQLDLRRRQVAVNVKVVDVNLLATEDFNSSFSFGWDDGFFVNDGGAASFNYGGVNPPSRTDVDGSLFSPPITDDLYPEGFDSDGPFLDAQPDAPFGGTESTGRPTGTFPVEVELPDGTTTVINIIDPRFPFGTLPRAPFGTDLNPLQPGITDIADDGTLEIGLPELFQYPTRFLASLQAQVVSGNAKILTDPTLMVQEGQTATVALTSQVYSGIRGTGPGEFEPIINDAGLTLQIQVERIDDNGFVTLAINPTVSSPGATVEAPGEQGDITLLQVRQLQSGAIRLRDGQTLILSGIIQESDRTTVSKVPILGDIPILGALFRSTERNNTRQEVIVLVTPQIMNDSDLSTFGYRYAPGQDVQQILQRQGVQVP